MTTGFGGRLDASYPTDVRNGGGIRVDKQGLATRIALDLRQTQRLSTLPANGLVPVQDPLTGLIGALPVTALPTAQTGDGTQTNAKLATMPARTFKANLLGTTAPPQDVNFTQVLEALGITSGGSVATTATNVSVVPPASQGYTNVQGAITSIEGRIGSGNGPITSNSITDATASGKAVLTGTPAQGRTALQLGTAATLGVGTTANTVAAGNDPRFASGGLNPGVFNGVQSTIAAPLNPENQQGFNDQKSTSYEALSVDVGGYGPSRFGGGQNGAATFGLPQAVCGKMNVPATSEMYAHAIGVGGWIRNYSPNAKTFAVGVYADARAMATGACSWGVNSVSADMGFATPLLYGYECDLNVDNPNTTALGVDIVGGSTVAPHDNSSALQIQAIGILPPNNAPKIPWPRGISIRAGSCKTAMKIEATTETANSGSPPILFFANNSSNVPYEAARIQGTAGGNFVIASSAPSKVLKLQAAASNGVLQDNITLFEDKVGIGGSGLPGYTLEVFGSTRVANALLVGGSSQLQGSLQIGGGFAMAGGAPAGKQNINGQLLGDINGLRDVVASMIVALVQFNMVNNNTY